MILKVSEENVWAISLLEWAVDKGATDIHLCPGAVPFVRINGKLEAAERGGFTLDEVAGFIGELLTAEQMEQLKAARVLSFTFAVSNLGRFRATAYSQRGSLAITIRSLPHEIPDFGVMGLSDELKGIMAKERGLVLVAGHSSVTAGVLASLLDVVNREKVCHITTVENPIEYLHRHGKGIISQKEIGGDVSDFKAGLVWSMCVDPDIIMLSDFPNDPELLMRLLSAAEEKLVLAGLNVAGAIKAIEYFVDAFAVPTQSEAVTEKQAQVRSRLAGVLECIISGRHNPKRNEGNKGSEGGKDGDSPFLCEAMVLSDETKRLIGEGRINSLKSKFARMDG
jgi:twitching motility protein PilT